MSRKTLSPDSPTVRLQLVITAGEIEAIDGWWHQHSEKSRSAAIRRLVQLGLETGRFRTSEELMAGFFRSLSAETQQ